MDETHAERRLTTENSHQTRKTWRVDVGSNKRLNTKRQQEWRRRPFEPALYTVFPSESKNEDVYSHPDLESVYLC